MMRVIIRYHDGRKFDGDWTEAPVWGVQTIAYFDEVLGYPVIRHQGDYYQIARDGSVIGVDANTVLRHMREAGARIEDQSVVTVAQWAAENGYKIGTMVGQHEYKRIFELGLGDRDNLR